MFLLLLGGPGMLDHVPCFHQSPASRLRVIGLVSVFVALLSGMSEQSTQAQSRAADSEVILDTQQKADEHPPATVQPVSATDAAAQPSLLLQEKTFGETWKHYSSRQDVALDDVWKLIPAADPGDLELVCTGDPKGFLYTVEEYSNFVLTFEWKYPDDPHGNSGILVFTQDERRLWPTSIQVQLHHPKAGSVFPSGDATSDNTSETPGLAVDAGRWNRCKIISKNGVVSVEINDRKAGEVSGCDPSNGRIAIQSEGSRVHFRRVLVTRTDLSSTASIENEVE